MHKFENLRVWQESVVLIQLIYLFCKKLPTSERNNLIDQIKRSSTSVALNIAAGSGSPNNIEYKRYLYIAKNHSLRLLERLKSQKSCII
jgi:four helix bundle protein